LYNSWNEVIIFNTGYEVENIYKMINCNDCGEAINIISSHRKNKLCLQYKDIIFTCRKCGYVTKSIKNIHTHILICDRDEDISDPCKEYKEDIERLETEKKYFQRKIRRLEGNLVKQEKANHDLNTVLEIERMKSRMFSHIIDQKTDLYTSDLLKEDKHSVHIYDIQNGILPVYLHRNLQVVNNVNEEDEIIILPPQQKKKEVYRAIKCVDLAEEEDQEEIQTKVENVDEVVKDIVDANFEEIDMDKCKKEIKSTFNKIRNARAYTKHLAYIKKIRCKMLGWLNIKEYEDLIIEHMRKLSLVFKGKKYDSKRIMKIISEGLSPLEMRLTKYGKYYETDIDSEDIERLKVSLEVCTVFPKMYKPFKRGFKRFQNYNMMLFTLKKCIECYLFNRYEFYNLVYINMPNSTEADPYSFYYLEKIDGDKRCWKMDCRLEDISVDMSTELLPYCIDLYKKVYRDMFRDNNYREDCEDVYSLAGNEMEQLAENIFILHNQERCRNLIRSIVKEKAELVPTDNDKVNIRTADSTQKKRFNEYRCDYNPLDVPCLLFQDINEDDAKHFLNRFK